MDNDFSMDLRDLARTIETNDVITMRFVTFGKRLLLDFRSSEIDGPMVKVVEPVKSARARYESLKELRPRFDSPEKIVAIAWPRFARSLDATEVWDAVMRRLVDSGHPESVRAAERALKELRNLEVNAQRDAIRGEGFRTLWSAEARRS
jgi:hypothetical protein